MSHIGVCISTIASSSVILECPTGEACINDVLQYNCTINGALKNWIVTEFQQSGEQISVNQFGTVLPSSDPYYTVTFTGYTANPTKLSSSLSLVATVQSDKTKIVCRNQIDQMLIKCTVQITGKHNNSGLIDCEDCSYFPDPPGDVFNVVIQATAVDSVTVTWSPVNKCISYYTVRSVVAVNTTDTSIVYNQLELGKVYSLIHCYRD